MKMKMKMNSLKREALLRMVCMFVLALTASLVGFDTQTKLIFYTYTKKATFHDLNALNVLVWIDSGAAVYNLLQLLRSYKFPASTLTLSTASSRYVAWGIYLLDQAGAYIVFATNSAALEASMVAITGSKSLQWMKWCNRFTRFCYQIGGALLCGYVAAIFMALTASLSAYSLFTIYSPKHFLLLKANSRRVAVNDDNSTIIS